ncbi:hypothetical protein J437_LFUL011018 [Ladona fulva]|uniref:Short-chain dehydrogenase/reductase 3 n=1 Tax=Ladona fulva TaxID=123851 RepID=A0A8K0P218_LADFU|nr:hypothetical protein J437_LFUL011018 [Ladona fulva]
MGFAIYDVPQGLRRLRASLVAAVTASPALLVAPTDELQIMKVDQRVVFKVLCAGILLIWVPLRSVFNSICSLFFKKPKRDMEKEIVLVTGAGRGLGRGMAIEFARLGATVVCWDINESGNKETAELASKYSRRKGAVRAYRCDVSNREEVLSVAEKVKEEVGDVTLLVNNAGIITAGRLETYKPEDIQRVVNVNFVSHFWTIEAFLPDMKTKNYGQIVCMSSMAALQPSEYMVPYSATKYAVTGLMDTLEEELLSSEYDNIQVTTVHPYFANSNNAMNQIDKQGDGFLGRNTAQFDKVSKKHCNLKAKNDIGGVSKALEDDEANITASCDLKFPAEQRFCAVAPPETIGSHHQGNRCGENVPILQEIVRSCDRQVITKKETEVCPCGTGTSSSHQMRKVHRRNAFRSTRR